MSADIKIQINNKEAMERLIGTDPEGSMAIELRDNIAKWFSEKYLANLVENGVLKLSVDVTKELNKAKQKIVEDAVAVVTNNAYSTVSKVELTPTIKALIKDTVTAQMDAHLKQELIEAKEKLVAKFEKALESNIKTFIESKTTELIRAHVAAQLGELTKHLTEMTSWYKQEAAKNKTTERNIALHL